LICCHLFGKQSHTLIQLFI